MSGARSRNKGKARAISRTADGHRMNGLETEWAQQLTIGEAWWVEAYDHDQAISSWAFEPMSLRIGTAAWYKPDFMAILEDGIIELHETKGSWRAKNQRAARVQIKAAAHQYPMFRFLAIRKKTKKQGGGWDIEEIKP